ncbi:hypothetical protein [Glycomyces albidus]|uniref:Uncharacterized protein n=1 Tax=Glycomyces albidus TaxID=2656774 RepID=A0A6L5G8G9_9ACTN|nr:hypothetical protein [Glycomyces albidus]MQM25911.1 hypothetical protein [Glycomyces albidus]
MYPEMEPPPSKPPPSQPQPPQSSSPPFPNAQVPPPAFPPSQTPPPLFPPSRFPPGEEPTQLFMPEVPTEPLPPRFERKRRYERKPRLAQLGKRPSGPRPADSIAAVAGNATAFGLGYMLMLRPRLSAAAITGTAILLLLLATDPGNLTWRLLFGLWWLAMCMHAWYLTRGHDSNLLDTAGRRRERHLAVGAAALVLLGLVVLRTDAWLTVRDAEGAHAAGDCETAVDTLEGFDAGHRVAFGAMVIEGNEQLEACRLLNEARAAGSIEGAAIMATYMDDSEALWDGAGPERAAMLFDAALDRENTEGSLDHGFQQLVATLDTEPGQEDRVRGAVEDLMAGLDGIPHCDAVAIDDWIRTQSWEAPELTEPVAAAAPAVPLHLLACARERARNGDLTGAQQTYERFLAEHPDHAETAFAVDELYAVESQIEFEHVEALLDAGTYCESPAPWRDAPPYGGPSPHPMRTVGLSPDQYGLPDSWTAATLEETEIIVCVDGPKRGRYLESCYYEGNFSPYINDEVSFYATRFDVTVYQLRTGQAVDSYTVQFNGDPCPEILQYTYYYTDLGPPSEVEAEVSDADVRSVFERLQD